jgi:hypothetical protein
MAVIIMITILIMFVNINGEAQNAVADFFRQYPQSNFPGSVEYLHNHQNKPFIRGGDFQQRKVLGESPMQLQYSRAFGGRLQKIY